MIIPRKGDIWEFQRPGKRKKRKEIGEIFMMLMRKTDGTYVRRPYVQWQRWPKGRYSGIRVKWLLKYGHRISTQAEREIEMRLLLDQAKERRRQKLTKPPEPH